VGLPALSPAETNCRAHDRGLRPEKLTAEAYVEMQDRGHRLLTCMPTDRRALVDLLFYLEKNFSIPAAGDLRPLAGVLLAAHRAPLSP
jgi:hypothetical protein